MKQWTKAEISALRDSWTKLADREIANLLGRSLESVRSYRRKILNLSRGSSGRERWLGRGGKRLASLLLQDYHMGASQSQLVVRYSVEWKKLHEILDSNSVIVRDKSQQAFLARYGALPRVRPQITRWKLYIIFAMLGDNLRPSSQAKRGTHIIGIAAGSDTDFAENWISNFEHEYKVRPGLLVQGANNIQCHISSVDIWRDLHKHAVFGRRCWRLRESIMHLLLSKMAEGVLGFGLRGFFDAEGCVKYQKDRAARQVTVYSVNFAGLKQVSRLLERLGIRHSLYTNTISIMGRPNLEAFQKTIGFSIKRKNEALNNMISTFQ